MEREHGQGGGALTPTPEEPLWKRVLVAILVAMIISMVVGGAWSLFSLPGSAGPVFGVTFGVIMGWSLTSGRRKR